MFEQEMHDRLAAATADLAAMTAHAERAEADARVLRTLVSTATMQYAASQVVLRSENRHVAVIAVSYLDALFEAAGDSGAFAADHCDVAAVVRMAESFDVELDYAQEAKP